MIGKSLTRNEMKQTTGGDPGCLACTSSCLYEAGGPGAGCPPGGNCVLTECNAWHWTCPEEYRYRAVCDWEV
ncbi:hypothetical protein [Pedobacter sp. UC225_65]|uniref:hypothetical protein n=1 Tax=Pedobacter sp. UC225_65 TaxID=3350173 RepID=UPI00366DFF77